MRCYSVRQNARRLYDLNSITSFARAVTKTNGFHDPTASEQFTPSQNMEVEAGARAQQHWRLKQTRGAGDGFGAHPSMFFDNFHNFGCHCGVEKEAREAGPISVPR